MMAQVNAGRVRFVGRGEYNNSTQYYVFDLVSYNGNSYYAKADTIGHLPTDTTYWQLVAEKGNIGPTGLTGNGISSIEKTSTSGLVDTYTITYTNGNTTTFDVSNGNGIDRIEKTATVGNKDTYTIYFTNGSTTTYEVSNGEVTREELEEEVDRLSMIYNAFPSTTGEVEEGSINGTAEVPFKEIGLKGNTSQESTTGTNYFNAYAITNSNIVVGDDGKSIKMPIVSSGNGYTSTYAKLKDLCPTLKVGDVVYLNFSRNLSETINKLIYLETPGIVWNAGTSKEITQQMLDSTVILYGNRYDSGETTQCIISDFRITKNSSDTWEKFTYGASPNPDYPYPVNVVTGDNEVKVEGKNLEPINSYNSQTQRQLEYNLSLPAGTYTLSYDLDSFTLGTNSSMNLYFKFLYVDDGEVDITSLSINSSTQLGRIAKTFTTTKDVIIDTTRKSNIRISSSSQNNGGKVAISNIQIESGSATTYTPYQSQTYPINIGSMELCKIGDYQDYLYKENGIWYKYGAIGKKTFNGTEEYTQYSTTNKFHTILDNALFSSDVTIKCDKYLGQTSGGGGSDYTNYTCWLQNTSNYKRIYFRNDSCADASAFTTFMSNNNATVIYPLETPTTTEITDTTLIEQLDNLEKAYSYDTQTNISQTNQDKPFIISYEAILSLRNVLNS